MDSSRAVLIFDTAGSDDDEVVVNEDVSMGGMVNVVRRGEAVLDMKSLASSGVPDREREEPGLGDNRWSRSRAADNASAWHVAW